VATQARSKTQRDDFRFGTFLPFLRASDKPMAMACFRLLTLPPRPPLPRLRVPRLRRRMALPTSFDALREYLRAIEVSPSLLRECRARSYALTSVDDTNSGFGRQHNAVDRSFVSAALLWRTDVGATIGCCNVLDCVLGDRQPVAIHLHLIVVVDHAGFGRPAICQIAARRLGVLADELRIEALVPSVMAGAVMTILCEGKRR
jgi:hypothetical protein